MDPRLPGKPTPRELVRLINQYLACEATWDDVTALTARTTFTHRDRPVYGEDDYTDTASWEDTVGLVFKLPTDKETELKKLARFV